MSESTIDPHSIPLAEIDVSDPTLFENDSWGPLFERLRREDPVHYQANSPFGPFWSITKFDDIMEIERNYEVFSSHGSIVIGDVAEEELDISPGFIAMDPPQHDQQRKVAQGVVAPRNLMAMEPLIRQRVQSILDDLPTEETFNWVDRVSIELTTQMLATLFDFPFEDRYKLTFWSDMATASASQVGSAGVTEEERNAALLECLEYFTRLWNERINREPGERLDLVTMLAHGEATKHMTPMEYLGNLILLIVGGNDTTRNSISGGVVALNENPTEYQKLRDNPSLIPSMVSEIIRWQTPLAHMRRTALQDIEFRGKQIAAGDKVVMWYISANRDEEAIERANEFLIDRSHARHHMSFGFGVHRCMGNRLAEMQLRIVWEEILQRFETVELVGTPVRARSNFVKGFLDVPVRLHAK
jgi:cytochrome P450